ncbi:MAG: GldG family protein [Eubacterium sp.]|jgi:ABC-2 type transport system permease protein|nr:GldG family protein [Eubacterium sp.]
MKNLFKDKRIKYGTYSTVVAMIFLAILVMINLVVGQFNRSFDTTKDKLFGLSSETQQVLDNMTSKVTIYTTSKTGSSDSIGDRVEQVLTQYKQKSKVGSLNVENIDLYLHPDFAKNYNSEDKPVSTGSIIVVSNDKYRVISESDYYDSENGQFSIESAITSAIQFVDAEELPAVYFVTGHGEAEPENFSSLSKQMSLANYSVKTINLLEDNIPTDCAVLMITPCSRDYSDVEAQKVKDYLTSAGRVYCIIGGIDTANCKNLMGIINSYGLTVNSGYIYEGDENSYMMYPYAVLPTVTENDITSQITEKGYKVLTVASQALENTEIKKKDVEINPLLTTSKKSYIKEGENTAVSKENGDKSGPFNVAVSVNDKSNNSKLIVTGCSYYLVEPNTDSMVNGANSTFVISGLNWLNDQSDNIYISPKDIMTETIVVDEASAGKLKILAWAVIPAIIFVIGFAVWAVRRNK